MSTPTSLKPNRWLQGHKFKFRRRVHAEDVLDHLQTACKILSALASGANLPMVSGVATAASTLITIAQVSVAPV